jgi:hypothetical protein
MFITEKAKAIDWLASSVREERLAVRYHRKEERQRKNLYGETQRAEDALRLVSLLLTGLAEQENAILERDSGICNEEGQEALYKRKLDTVEAIRASLFGRRE